MLNDVPDYFTDTDLTLKGKKLLQGLVSVCFTGTGNHHHIQFELKETTDRDGKGMTEATYRLLGIEIDVKRGKSVNTVLDEYGVNHYRLTDIHALPYERVQDVVGGDVYEYLTDLILEGKIHEK